MKHQTSRLWVRLPLLALVGRFFIWVGNSNHFSLQSLSTCYGHSTNSAPPATSWNYYRVRIKIRFYSPFQVQTQVALAQEALWVGLLYVQSPTQKTPLLQTAVCFLPPRRALLPSFCSTPLLPTVASHSRASAAPALVSSATFAPVPTDGAPSPLGLWVCVGCLVLSPRPNLAAPFSAFGQKKPPLTTPHASSNPTMEPNQCQ